MLTVRRGAADPKIGKDYKFFYPDAEALVVGMTTANTHFEDIKIKAKRKVGEGECPVLVRHSQRFTNLTRHAMPLIAWRRVCLYHTRKSPSSTRV